MKAVVAAFNQEKALVGAFSVITNLRMELFEALLTTHNMTMTVLGQVFVAEGEPAMFECRVEPKHDLNLSVRWYRNEEELVSAGHAGTRDT